MVGSIARLQPGSGRELPIETSKACVGVWECRLSSRRGIVVAQRIHERRHPRSEALRERPPADAASGEDPGRVAGTGKRETRRRA
jgi:hypothetical protein